jgi:hypothetical protein
MGIDIGASPASQIEPSANGVPHVYFDLRTFLTIPRLIVRERPGFRRGLLLIGLFTLLTINSLIGIVCLALDHVLFPGFRRVPVRTPVFVLGNARSGTTHMHRLLCGDEGRFSYFRTYELLLPSILQKKAVRLVAAFDERVLKGAIERRLRGREDLTLAEVRKMHDWRLNAAEEDEFILFHNWSSASLTLIFPYMRGLDYLFHVDERPEIERGRVLGFYRSMVRRQIYLYGGATIHCSKNPTFVLKMRSILETFPDARFVYMARHPDETIPSLLDVMGHYWRTMGTDAEIVEESVRLLGELQIDQYRYAREVLDGLSAEQYVEVRYTELLESPKKILESVYARFGFDVSPEYERFLDEEQRKSETYQSEHEYDLSAHAEVRERARRELGDLFARYGWEV